jgi:hypothetical protein
MREAGEGTEKGASHGTAWYVRPARYELLVAISPMSEWHGGAGDENSYRSHRRSLSAGQKRDNIWNILHKPIMPIDPRCISLCMP